MKHRTKLWTLTALSALLGALGAGPTLSGCTNDPAGASARIITSRAELIGGDRAIGEIGDYLIENEKVRFIIHKAGPSRGFGVFGGSLIDADLRRPTERPAGGDGAGHDQFAEMFPGMFVQAAAVDEVKVTSDGADGGPARIEASGYGGDFFEMLAIINKALTGSHVSLFPGAQPQLRYTTIYDLEPGNQYLTVRFRVTNLGVSALSFPSPIASDPALAANFPGLDLTGFTVPIGDVALFGATSRLFIPGVGFDLRFGLDRAYEKGADWPAFPGLLAEFVASKGEDTSYGIVARPSDRNFVKSKNCSPNCAEGQKDAYGDGITPITDSTMLVPFTTAGAIGIFYENAPATLDAGASFEVERYFVVGSGDVGSVVDVVNEIRGADTGRLTARVLDSRTGEAAVGASVLVLQRAPDGTRRPFSQYDVKASGLATGTLPKGSYSLRVTGEGRPETPLVDFEITTGATSAMLLQTDPPARVFVHVRDERGLPMPAKATAIGRYGADHAGQPTPSFLFDLPAGEEFRTSDLVTDTADDPETRRYIEAVGFARGGVVELDLRPGTYDIVTSRGPEYELVTTTVTVDATQATSIQETLRRVVDTTGWIAMDTHVHSRESPDSAMKLDDRVLALAAEGVEVPVATDHNVLTDYGPYVARNELTEWMHPIVGVELTTLESGHFNSYPLEYQAGMSTHGSFEWAGLRPGEIFERLRNMGSLGHNGTIIQVNHPRDEVLGYFNQYERDALNPSAEHPVLGITEEPLRPRGPAFLDESLTKTAFSFDFEAIELANGKLYWEIRHYRVPEELPDGDLPDEIPPAGTILTDADGEVAFPGVVDDWFNLLNLGYSYIGVGSCDSHSGHDEAGQFRTMVYVGDDHPAAVTDRTMVNGLRSRRVLVTNGPMLDFFVNDPDAGAMGKTLVDGDGTVSLTVKLSSAPWIGVDAVNVYRNGLLVKTIAIEPGRDLVKSPLAETFDLPLATTDDDTPKDSWFVVEAIGSESMFPVIRPQEIPPLMLVDAVSSLAGPLGFGQDEYGALRPPEVFPVTAYAITNPVWVTRAAGPFQPPGLVPPAVQNQPENDPKFQRGARARWTIPHVERRVKRASRVGERCDAGRCVPWLDPIADDPFDVRGAIRRYGTPHGH
jgi:hypothetical protein